MKIKRKSIGGKISDTKHEVVINTADIASSPKSASAVGGKFPVLPPSTLPSKPPVSVGNSIPLSLNATAISNSTAIPKSSPPDRTSLSHGANSTSTSSPLAPSSVITATTNNALVVPTSATTNSSTVLPIPAIALNQASAASALAVQPSSNSNSAANAASAYISDLVTSASGSGKQSSKHSTSSSKSSKSAAGSSSSSTHRDKKEKNGKGDKGVLGQGGTSGVSSPITVGNALLKVVPSQGLTKETPLDKGRKRQTTHCDFHSGVVTNSTESPGVLFVGADVLILVYLDAPPTTSTSSSSHHLPSGVPTNLTLKYSASGTSTSAVAVANLASTSSATTPNTTISPCQTVILRPNDEMMASAAALIARSVAGLSSSSALSLSLASNLTNPKKINAEDVRCF